ncbi:hypothetical protein FRC02_001531 [Tulasnella sp. 418]|nr:hypothetical protein FRC02_001531 [Tulasnella sp. 418]
MVLDVWLDWRRPNVDDLDRLPRLLTSCVKQSLKSLTLGATDMENDTGFLLPPSSLEPFFQLAYLKILQLDIQIPIDVSDEDVSLILSALPKLEDLLLSCNIRHVPSNFTPKLSSDCLLKFAKEGTNLRKVGAFIGDWRKVEEVGCSQSQITEIQVGRSALPSNWTEEVVVEQLLIIFPRLRLLRDSNMVRNDIYNIEYKGNSPWYRVYELLSMRESSS